MGGQGVDWQTRAFKKSGHMFQSYRVDFVEDGMAVDGFEAFLKIT